MSNPERESLSPLEQRLVDKGYVLDELAKDSPYALSLDDDAPLVCNRDQSGDTTCESCQ